MEALAAVLANEIKKTRKRNILEVKRHHDDERPGLEVTRWWEMSRGTHPAGAGGTGHMTQHGALEVV